MKIKSGAKQTCNGSFSWLISVDFLWVNAWPRSFLSILRLIYGTQTLFFCGGFATSPPSRPARIGNKSVESLRLIHSKDFYRWWFQIFFCASVWNLGKQVSIIQKWSTCSRHVFLVALGWILKPPTMWLVFYWGHRLSASCPVKRAEPAGMKMHKDPWIQWANHRHITDPTPTSL